MIADLECKNGHKFVWMTGAMTLVKGVDFKYIQKGRYKKNSKKYDPIQIFKGRKVFQITILVYSLFSVASS